MCGASPSWQRKRSSTRPGSGTRLQPRNWAERLRPSIGDTSVMLSPQLVDLLLRRLNPFKLERPEVKEPESLEIKRRAIAHVKPTLGSCCRCPITAACRRQVPGCCAQRGRERHFLFPIIPNPVNSSRQILADSRERPRLHVTAGTKCSLTCQPCFPCPGYRFSKITISQG